MSQLHALIIEDNSRNMSVLGSLLAKQGLSHTDVLDPDQVSAVLDEIDVIDIVFLDLEMPNKDGYEVLKLLQAEPRFAKVPVVACTVHANEMNTAFESGFHSFLGKPLDTERFPEQLARILKNERVWERT